MFFFFKYFIVGLLVCSNVNKSSTGCGGSQCFPGLDLNVRPLCYILAAGQEKC